MGFEAYDSSRTVLFLTRGKFTGNYALSTYVLVRVAFAEIAQPKRLLPLRAHVASLAQQVASQCEIPAVTSG